jgi:hypothetical protein
MLILLETAKDQIGKMYGPTDELGITEDDRLETEESAAFWLAYVIKHGIEEAVKCFTGLSQKSFEKWEESQK